MIKAYDLNYWLSEAKILSYEIDEKIRKFPTESRDSISSDLLKHLRDLVEHVAVCFYLNQNQVNYENQYNYIEKGISYIKKNGKYRFLHLFYDALEMSVSHYSLFGDSAERMMLKYLKNLVILKNEFKKEFKEDILDSLTLFPIDMDTTFQSYYREIIKAMSQITFSKTSIREKDTYYVQKKKFISVDNHVFFEYTLSPANDSNNKFDRFTAFSPLDIFDSYAIKASYTEKDVSLFDKKTTIRFLTDYTVSVRPCEFEKLFYIVGIGEGKNYSPGNDYQILMQYIQTQQKPLDRILEMDDYDFDIFVKSLTKKSPTILCRFLIASRTILNSQVQGKNIFKYLLHTIDNRIIKAQLTSNFALSNTIRVSKNDRLFDLMPYVFSPVGHNPKFNVLCDCFSLKKHENELIKRYVSIKSDSESKLYIKINNDDFEKTKSQVDGFNKDCTLNGFDDNFKLGIYGKYIFERSAENDTHDVLLSLLKLTKKLSFPNFSNFVNSRMSELAMCPDDPLKKSALKSIYKNSSLFAVYGSAGTGKTTFARHVLDILGNDTRTLCVTNTNPALMNLKNKLSSNNVKYQTVFKCNHSRGNNLDCDLLIIDECSTISNRDMLGILRNVEFKLILLLGDIHQIEAIQFGNWFSLLKFFLPSETKVELTTQFRAIKNNNLPLIWDAVRNGGAKILEIFTKHQISKPLSSDIFKQSSPDEIILCLNYDGLYGINNINNYLQENNPNPAIHWKQYTFKVGDPILFTENTRFGSILYNNLKGKIVKIEDNEDALVFQILVSQSINPLSDTKGGLTIINVDTDGNSLISFSVKKAHPKDYEKDMESDCQIPFQIAYAVSIHKAQGLEYDSVKIVLSNEVEELISHNIFYTAITRAKNDLTIYWTPETENKIISLLKFDDGQSDFNLLKSKFKDLKEWADQNG